MATDPQWTTVEIIAAFVDGASIEQGLHDAKEFEGAGQQQVRHIWSNIRAYHLILWAHALVEIWAWHGPKEGI